MAEFGRTKEYLLEACREIVWRGSNISYKTRPVAPSPTASSPLVAALTKTASAGTESKSL